MGSHSLLSYERELAKVVRRQFTTKPSLMLLKGRSKNHPSELPRLLRKLDKPGWLDSRKREKKVIFHNV